MIRTRPINNNCITLSGKPFEGRYRITQKLADLEPHLEILTSQQGNEKPELGWTAGRLLNPAGGAVNMVHIVIVQESFTAISFKCLKQRSSPQGTRGYVLRPVRVDRRKRLVLSHWKEG